MIISSIMDGEVLRRDTIILDKFHDDAGIFDHVDAFVNLRENKTVEGIRLCLDTDPGAHRYAILGQNCRRHWKSAGAPP
jgi:hypothetical protein